MAREHRVRDIAVQAGLSATTVDRVLNGRAGVSARARRQVDEAIHDLDRQASQIRLGGRTLVVDLVMQAPARFSQAVRTALEAALPGLRPAVLRARFDVSETASSSDIVKSLDKLPKRGSQGVILKAPDEPEVIEAVDHLVDAGIPVVTLVTDLPTSRRVAYVGIDNRSAGATRHSRLTRPSTRSTRSVAVTARSSKPSPTWTGPAGTSSLTTWMRTTSPYCAPAPSPSYCTTTCPPTCTEPASTSCMPTTCSRLSALPRATCTRSPRSTCPAERFTAQTGSSPSQYRRTSQV